MHAGGLSPSNASGKTCRRPAVLGRLPPAGGAESKCSPFGVLAMAGEFREVVLVVTGLLLATALYGLWA